jgi:hypothetical protein
MSPTVRAILHALSAADPQGLDLDALDDLHLTGLKPTLAKLVKQRAVANDDGIYRIADAGRAMLAPAGGAAGAAPSTPMVDRIEMRAPADLRPDPRNARTHDEAQITALATSIRQFGFNFPIGIDSDGQVVAGHGRREAALLLGLPRVPCVVLSHLNADQRRAFMVADNRLAELSGWDEPTLLAELRAITSAGIELQAIGYDEDALREIAESVNPPAPEEAEAGTKSYDVVVDCDSAAKRRKAMRLLKDGGFTCHPFNKSA